MAATATCTAHRRLALLRNQLAPSSHHTTFTLPFNNCRQQERSCTATLPAPRITPIISAQSLDDAGKLTVVLDMDECLLHSRFEPIDPRNDGFRGDTEKDTASTHSSREAERFTHPDKKYDYHITFTIDKGQIDAARVFVCFRPHLFTFLSTVASLYEPILFTSALPVYATPATDWLLTHYGAAFRHRLYRSSTVTFGGVPYVKDIRRLNRPMNSIVILDNNPLAMIATPENGIAVPDFYGDNHHDDTLLQVLQLLQHLDAQRQQHAIEEKGNVADIRPLLKQLLKSRTPETHT